MRVKNDREGMNRLKHFVVKKEDGYEIRKASTKDVRLKLKKEGALGFYGLTEGEMELVSVYRRLNGGDATNLLESLYEHLHEEWGDNPSNDLFREERKEAFALMNAVSEKGVNQRPESKFRIACGSVEYFILGEGEEGQLARSLVEEQLRKTDRGGFLNQKTIDEAWKGKEGVPKPIFNEETKDYHMKNGQRKILKEHLMNTMDTDEIIGLYSGEPEIVGRYKGYPTNATVKERLRRQIR
jgi:hypothetical protein